MSEQQIRTAAGSILYDDSRVGKPGDELFSRDHWAGSGALVEVPGGRGQVLFIRDATRQWVLRHYRRGGLIAKVLVDAYLWLGASRTRSFAEWRLLSRLHAEGFPVPAPVAARYVRSGLVYRADLITAEITGSRTLADSITGASLESRVWQDIGRVLASLHDRGVHHADLNAHNILLDAASEVHVIDFDRARIRSHGAWQREVLARLKRSLQKIGGQRQGVRFGEAEWTELLRGYDLFRR